MDSVREQSEVEVVMTRTTSSRRLRKAAPGALRAAAWATAMVCIRQIAVSHDLGWLWLTYAWLNFPAILGEVPLRLVAGFPLTMVFPSEWPAAANAAFDGAVAFVIAASQWLLIELLARLWLAHRRAQPQ